MIPRAMIRSASFTDSARSDRRVAVPEDGSMHAQLISARPTKHLQSESGDKLGQVSVV